MKKLEKVRNREVARVLLIEARGLIATANKKLNDIQYNSPVERKFEDINENIHALLGQIVQEQGKEK